MSTSALAAAAPPSRDLSPEEVLLTLSRHLLVDGFDLVLDLTRSEGVWLVDARTGKRWLDMFTFFASSALGLNHPKLVGDLEFRDTLGQVALSKVSNSDIYTVELARFAETFSRVLGDPELPHLFFIEGGALAVENALKVAFDWKSRRNEAAGRSPEKGTQVMHLRRAFHGRTGYTLSLTNTETIKTARFPKFAWPRIDSPAARFPLAEFTAENAAAEASALAQARAAFEANPHDIACFVCEPIQGEGGDNHLRPEFLSAMQALCEEFDALFVLDEVQSGCGLTGTPWAYQQLGVHPDIVAFGKKLQVCGIMAGRRVDEVPDNVFVVSSRLNSTWGGNLTDMVRARRILEVIESDDLIAHAGHAGQYLQTALTSLGERHPALVSNVRGRGLMCALTLPSGAIRDDILRRCRDEESLLLLGCGTDAIRWRPMLCVSIEELDMAVSKLDAVLARIAT